MQHSFSLFIKLLFVLLYCCFNAQAQQLGKIAPVWLTKGKPADSSSFVITTADYSYFKGMPLAYAPAIEIIDAAQPWPPRWFALHPVDTATDLSTSGMIILNADEQAGKFVFFAVIPTGANMNSLAILICNKNMEVVDTFYRQGREIDAHDFKLSENGDMMYFNVHDTIADLSKVTHNLADSAVKMVYQSIQIDNKNQTPVFTWNPLQKLGFDAMYLPYRNAPGVMSGNNTFEWSHGNSLQYDFDGNILFSFKHIGIGKIARTDGHLIWHIDRNNPKANAASDAIPLYLQHDLQVVKDKEGNVLYTVVSNGDDEHPVCFVYRFTVKPDSKGNPIIKLLSKIQPAEKTLNTGGGGNFDEQADGVYLFNYGLFKQDSTLKARALFEYKDAAKNEPAEYSIARNIFAYRIHKMAHGIPERPVVTAKDGLLISTGNNAEKQWYKLVGKDLQTVEYAGRGQSFKPKTEGYYCVSVKYGIGWAVSKVYHFTGK